MRPRTARTAGEQASVFSLKSRRRPSRLPSGGWYSFMARTRARGVGWTWVAGSGTGRPPSESSANGVGVGGEAFGFGDQCGVRAKGGDALRRIFLDGDQFDEIVDTQPPAHPGHAAGGQGVIGSGNV